MTKRDKYQGRWLTSQGVCPPVRWRLGVLLLLLAAFGAQGARAQEEKTFPAAYQTVKYAAGTTYDLQLAGFVGASYSIDATAGDVGTKKVGDVGTVEISGDGTDEHPYKIAGVSGGGAIRIKAEESGTGTDATYYVLTVAYPTGKTWDFSTVTQSSVGTWTDTGTRQTYSNATMGNAPALTGANAFVIPETAGLLFQTADGNLSVCEKADPSDFQYVGISGIGSSFTIPGLTAGDVVELNWKTDGTGTGKLFSATNVTDLSGRTVSGNFTIADCGSGRYSFLVAANGDVTFTLQDAGTCDLLSVRTYSGPYSTTMASITGSSSPVTLNGSSWSATLTGLSSMNATASGSHARYELVSSVGNLTGYSLTPAGELSATDGYGRVTVRVNDYTADATNPYLIGYSADFSVLFGAKPRQKYPFTWDFENISGGALLGRSNNAASSISTDYQTWTNLGYETFMLNTDGASLYVPGATLVSAARSLGEKGSVNTLNSSGKGNDEFNGLGFTGQIAFKLAQQGETANDAPETMSGGSAVGTLLAYRMDDAAVNDAYEDQSTIVADKTTWTPAELEAGDGKVLFGSPGKRENSTVGTHTKVYRMDGGNSKYLLLMPERPFQNDDHIILTGYSSANVAKSGFSFYAQALDATALTTLYWPSGTAANTETTIDYVVKRGDGICGRSQVYVFRADKTNTVLLSEVSITGTDTEAPIAYAYRDRAIHCVTATTITIPDLKAGDFVYLKSSAAPSSSTNLTDAVTADGLDATTDVRKYKVAAAGNATLTFAADTKVYRIGVTGITKQLTRVGSGDAWATDSRPTTVTQDAAIDYTQTGKFTVNDIKANIVSATKYTLKNVTVRMNELTNAVPAETGVVVKLALADDATAVDNFAKARGGNAVPLFAPPHSATILSRGAVGFGGTQGNLMMVNLDRRELLYERETGVIDKDGDNVDDSGAAEGDYTRFIFAQRYMKWQKVDKKTATYSGFTDTEGNVPVFYRMHIYTNEQDGKSATVLNTLGDNKAYMLIRSTSVPDALWKDAAAPAREFIGIEGVSEFLEDSEFSESSEYSALSGTYNLRGQKMDDDAPLPPGVYIRNGKKIVIK